MPFLRKAIVVCAIVALLPSDKGKQQQLYQQAVDTAEHVATYCDRNAETCAKGAAIWHDFKAKAAFAGGLALDALGRYASGPSDGPSDWQEAQSPRPSRAERVPAAARGTLTDSDLRPAWRASGDVRAQRPGI